MCRYVCLHVGMYTWVQVPTEIRDTRSCGAEVADCCKLPDVGAKELNPDPLDSSMCTSPLSPLSSPSISSFGHSHSLVSMEDWFQDAYRYQNLWMLKSLLKNDAPWLQNGSSIRNSLGFGKCWFDWVC